MVEIPAIDIHESLVRSTKNSCIFFLTTLMHNVYKVVTLQEKSYVVLVLKYLLTCDHFVKVFVKGLTTLFLTMQYI